MELTLNELAELLRDPQPTGGVAVVVMVPFLWHPQTCSRCGEPIERHDEGHRILGTGPDAGKTIGWVHYVCCSACSEFRSAGA